MAVKDSAPSLQDGVQQAIGDHLNTMSNALEDGLSAASTALISTTAVARDEAAAAASTARGWYAAALGHLEQADAAVIGTLKRGVVLASEHEVVAMAGGAAAAALLLPGPRRLLWRATLGRLRSPEAAYKSAELKVAALVERVDGQGGEVQKLAERLALAQEEHKRGLAKLRATASELRSLSGRVHSTERSARSLIDGLRELRPKEALQLRSEAAVKAAAAAGQRASLEKLVASLAKDGV